MVRNDHAAPRAKLVHPGDDARAAPAVASDRPPRRAKDGARHDDAAGDARRGTAPATDARARLLAGLPVTERELRAGRGRDRAARGRRRPAGGAAARSGGERRPLAAGDPRPGGHAPRRRARPARPRRLGARRTAPSWTPSRMLAWLGALIERTCDVPPVLVGYALGGAVAARFAAAQPDRVARAGARRRPRPRPVRAGAGVPPGARRVPHRARRGPPTTPCGSTARSTSTPCARAWARSGSRSGPTTSTAPRTPSVLAALGASMAHFGMPAIPPEELDRIGVRTTLIWGRHDLATPVAVAEAASARHGWPLRVIEDAADDPPVEQPEAFLDALRERARTARSRTAWRPAASRGEAVGPDHVRYDELRRVFNGMVDRRPAADRPLRDGRRRRRRARLRPRSRPPRVGLRRRAQRDRQRRLRRRRHDRPAADEGDRDRRRTARTCDAGAGLTWGELDAATQRARPRGHRRADVDDRPGRARARRRLGMDRAPVRLHGRQPARGRGRDGGRADRDGLRAASTRSCSGARAAAAATSAS